MGECEQVDFRECKEVTPSYRELPKDVQIPPCSGRFVFVLAVSLLLLLVSRVLLFLCF